jgi:hypothetical protein
VRLGVGLSAFLSLGLSLFAETLLPLFLFLLALSLVRAPLTAMPHVSPNRQENKPGIGADRPWQRERHAVPCPCGNNREASRNHGDEPLSNTSSIHGGGIFL